MTVKNCCNNWENVINGSTEFPIALDDSNTFQRNSLKWLSRNIFDLLLSHAMLDLDQKAMKVNSLLFLHI